MMLFNQKIVVVIPTFNESKTIEKAIKGVKYYTNEIIVVDDGSYDDTGLKAKKAGAIVIRHEQNKGYDASIEDGFREALRRGASVIVTFDADGQHKPEDIKKLTDPILTGKADIAIGQRQRTFHFCEKILALYTNLQFGIKDPLCGLKAYKRKVYESVGHFDTMGSIGTQLMIEALYKGFKMQIVPIIIEPRADQSRFYFNHLKANFRILKALIGIISLQKK